MRSVSAAVCVNTTDATTGGVTAPMCPVCVRGSRGLFTVNLNAIYRIFAPPGVFLPYFSVREWNLSYTSSAGDSISVPQSSVPLTTVM